MEMMAMRLYGPMDLRYEKIPVPELRENDIRVKIAYCGICGTDEEFYFGTSPFWADGTIQVPLTMGHECSGIVDGIGERVTNIKIGDRVILDSGAGCGQCIYCTFGRRNECEGLRSVGTINNIIDGGFAEYVVMPERGVFLLPENVSLQSGALIEPLTIALYTVERANIGIGDTVLIAGTGSIGLGAIPFVRARGAKKIIVAGRKDYKLDVAGTLGADVTINIHNTPMIDAVNDLTGGKGVDRIIEATGSTEVLSELLELAALNACISTPSFYNREMERFPINRLVLKNVSLQCVIGGGDTCPRVIGMLASGHVDPSPLITHYYPIENALQAFDDIKHNAENRIKCLFEISV